MLDGDPLVLLAERKLLGEAVDSEVANVMTGILAQHSASFARVILACTHFPLLQREIANALPSDAKLLDSGEAIARRVQSFISSVSERDNASFLSSGEISSRLEKSLLNEGFSAIKSRYNPLAP